MSSVQSRTPGLKNAMQTLMLEIAVFGMQPESG
jgi:hypothetical protein